MNILIYCLLVVSCTHKVKGVGGSDKQVILYVRTMALGSVYSMQILHTASCLDVASEAFFKIDS